MPIENKKETDLNGRLYRAVIYNAASLGNLKRVKVFTNVHKSDKQWLEECFNDSFTDRYPLVIAARNGHKEVVEYLLGMGASPSVRGCVEFDNDNILGTPPLWAASAAGHLDIVKLLVEKAHADVNQATNTQSTPLRGACYDGHLEIVKYLLENGADPHIPNRHGHTCLMIAAYRNKLDIVDELIRTGLDVNVQTERGNTALHDAAESGNVEVVKALITAGAKMSKDIQGVDPLLCAAQSGSSEVVNFLSLYQPSGIRRRDALKLLGSTLLDKKMDSMAAMMCWRKAMDVPLTNTENFVVREMETYFKPQAVYDKQEECQYEEDLELLEGNLEGQRMQALLIRERILGGAHTDVHYYLRFRGAVYCDMGLMDKCYELWKHALELQQKHFPPLYSGAITTLISFQETFAMTLNDFVVENEHNAALRVSSHWVQFAFEGVCTELERTLEWGDKPLLEDTECCGKDKCTHSTVEEEMKKLVMVAVQLINIRDRLSLPSMNRDDIEDVSEFQLCMERFVNVCEFLRIPLLHYALEQKKADSVEVLALPKAAVLEQLLDMGLDVTRADKNGDTPLHIVLRAKEFRKSLVRSLLARGASLLARNAEGEIVLDVMKMLQQNGNDSINFDDLKLGRNISLVNIVANQMRVKYAKLFVGVERYLPVTLRKIYLNH